MIGVFKAINPTMAGMLMKETSRKVKESVSFNSSMSSPEASSERLGRDAIPMAMAKIPKRKLHQPVCKEEIGDASAGKKGGKDGIDEDIELVDRRSDKPGNHQRDRSA